MIGLHAFCLLLAGFVVVGSGVVAAEKNQPIRQIPQAGKKIALTFDDGPTPGTLKIMEVLKAAGGKATFFMMGANVEKNPAVAKKIIEEGFEIGNHTWSHPNLKELDKDKIRKEIVSTQEIIKKETGFTPAFIRTPFLSYGDNTWVVLNELKLRAVDESIHTHDYSNKTTKEKIVDVIAENLKPGSVVLMHCWPENTLKALPEVIKHLKENGYEMVTMSELVKAEKPTVEGVDNDAQKPMVKTVASGEKQSVK